MNAQRASAPVRFARLAAVLLFVGLAAAVAVRLAGRRAGPPSLPVAPPPPGRIVDLQERVRQQEFKDGLAVADIRGQSFFRGPDGRNHLKGAVEFANLGPAGETVSRLSADEVVYDPGSLRFAVEGHVRVEAAGVVLEGDAFEYDKTAGLFETKSGGRFSSKTLAGSAPEIAYLEAADEIRLGGGFRARIGAAGRTDGSLAVSGTSLAYVRRERRGRIEGRASIQGAGFRGTSGAVSFVASGDEAGLDSAVFEDAASIVLAGKAPSGEGSGEIRAGLITVRFTRDPDSFALATSGDTRLALRSAADKTETVLAPTLRLNYSSRDGRCTWSASGGIRAGIADGDGPGRTLEGQEAVFDEVRVLRVSGAPGRPAVADSAEARIEAPSISVATDTGRISATDGVTGILKSGEAERPVGFFSPRDDVVFSSEKVELRPESSTSLFTGNVLIRQGTSRLQAREIEVAGDAGRMSGGGGVAITLTETAGTRARTIELSGRDMAYRSDERILALSSKAMIRLPEARLEAGFVSAVLAREGTGVESLAAEKDVIVSKAPYEGRSAAASYLAATDRITLTGRPVLTDGKGGSARADKLTFDLADDKIFIENEGSGRATTVVRS
jgi:lipopolysaccharide export system protein LptA